MLMPVYGEQTRLEDSPALYNTQVRSSAPVGTTALSCAHLAST